MLFIFTCRNTFSEAVEPLQYKINGIYSKRCEQMYRNVLINWNLNSMRVRLKYCLLPGCS